MTRPRFGWVHFDGFAGRIRCRIEVLKETPKRFRVRLLEGAYRHAAGKILLPPKWAVTFDKP